VPVAIAARTSAVAAAEVTFASAVAFRLTAFAVAIAAAAAAVAARERTTAVAVAFRLITFAVAVAAFAAAVAVRDTFGATAGGVFVCADAGTVMDIDNDASTSERESKTVFRNIINPARANCANQMTLRDFHMLRITELS
jgi:hypothetical protein